MEEESPLLFFRYSSENDTFFSFVPLPVVLFPMMTSLPTTETPGGGVMLANCFPFPLLEPPTGFVMAVVGVVIVVLSVGSIFPVLVDGPPLPLPFIVVPFIIVGVVGVEDDLSSLSSLGVSSPSNGIEYQFDPNKKDARPSHPLPEVASIICP